MADLWHLLGDHQGAKMNPGWAAPLIALAALFLGCNPSVREVMEQAFAEDPLVLPEYQPDGSRLFKTRNIVLEAEYGNRRLTSLVLVMALSEQADSMDDAGALLKFKSVAPHARFTLRQNLALNIGGQLRDLGPCQYTMNVSGDGAITEDLSKVLPIEFLRSFAGIDSLSGSLGDIPFFVSGTQLLPIRALADTARIREP